MLRVAFVTGTLQLGGATTLLLNLAGELLWRGIDCRIFSGDSLHPLAKDFDRLRLRVSLQNHRDAIFEDRVENILRQLRDYRPSAVVATLGPLSFEVLRYVPAGVRRLAMAQSDDPAVYTTLSSYPSVTDAFVAVSSEIERKMRLLPAFHDKPVHYLPCGAPIPEQLRTVHNRNQPLRIVYLGRIASEQKRVHLFPQIQERLRQAGIPFRWTIAGDGPDRDKLEQRMRSENPTQQVNFTGTVEYGNVPELLDRHDVFLLTSDYEGLPLSVLEAMASGLVPVVTDLPGGLRDVVDDRSGFLVSPGNVDGYAEAILHLHRNREELAAKSGAAQNRVRHQFSVSAMTARWLPILQDGIDTVTWPDCFRIMGPLLGRQQWKYRFPFRLLRRIAKRIRGQFAG